MKRQHYKIHYVDGHDLKDKVFETDCCSLKTALDRLWKHSGGDYDHWIRAVIVDGCSVK